MRTIDWYMAEARSRGGLRSERALARSLGLSARSVQQWRQGIAWPKDETMVQLADLAGVDRQTALLELARWRAEGTSAAPIWDSILKDTGRAAASLVLAAIIAIGGVDLDDGNAAQAQGLTGSDRNTSSDQQFILWIEIHCAERRFSWRLPVLTPAEPSLRRIVRVRE